MSKDPTDDRLTVRVARARIRHAVKGYRLRNLTREAMRALVALERSMTPDMALEAPSPEEDECEIVPMSDDVLLLALQVVRYSAPRCETCHQIATYWYVKPDALSDLGARFACGDHKPSLNSTRPVLVKDALDTLRRLGYV